MIHGRKLVLSIIATLLIISSFHSFATCSSPPPWYKRFFVVANIGYDFSNVNASDFDKLINSNFNTRQKEISAENLENKNSYGYFIGVRLHDK